MKLLILLLLGLLSGVAYSSIANCASSKTTTTYHSCNTITNCNTNCYSGYYSRDNNCPKRTCCLRTVTETCNSCNPGYLLSTNKKSCDDRNECLNTNPTACNGTTCANTPGSFSCGDCPTGTHGNGIIGCTPCNSTSYGFQCSYACSCGLGLCNSIDGTCNCANTGFSGPHCEFPVCGDGRVVAGEQCDDGNTNSGDCCSSTCQFDALGTPCTTDNNPCTTDSCGNRTGICEHSSSQCDCGNFILEPGEACDAGPSPNTMCPYGLTTCQLCNSTCKYQAGQATYCGDGVVSSSFGELCDDGGSFNGDGCSAGCQIETGYLCLTPGSPCTPCNPGKYGYNCMYDCACSNGAPCDKVNGQCECVSPWIGAQCTSLPTPSDDTVTGTYNIIVNDNSGITFTDAFPSSLTRIAFVPAGAPCTSNFVGVTGYSNPSAPRQSVLPEAKDYSLCLSYDSAQSYVKQTGAVVHGLPPAATSTSISSLSPQNLIINDVSTMTIVGAVPSATSFLAFSTSPTCSPVHGVTALPLSTGTTVVMGASIADPGEYYVCYSTDNEATYVAQMGIPLSNVAIADASATSILQLDPDFFTVGSTPSLEVIVTPAPLPSTAKIAFVRNPDCSTNLLGQTDFVTNPANLNSALTLTGIYRICYTTDTDYVLQQRSTAVIEVLPPAATDSSLSGVSSPITAFTTPVMTFTGAVPSAHTFVAFSKLADCSEEHLVGITALSSTNGSTSQTLGSSLTSTGTYRVCYSTDDGTTYELQTTPTVSVLPPPATATTLTTLVPDNFLTSETPVVQFKGAVPSDTTLLALLSKSSNSDCATGPRVSEISLDTSNTGTIDNSEIMADDYFVCYSVNDGGDWVQQSEVTFSVYPPPATNTSITSISPRVATVGDLGTFNFGGVVPSKTTMISFTFGTHSNCSDLQGATQVTQPGNVQIASALRNAVGYKVCYSTDAGLTWFLQSTSDVDVSAVPPAASTTSISAIFPSSIVVSTTADFSFTGAVPSSTTRFSFVPLGSADCSSPLLVTNFVASPTTISGTFSEAKSFSLCYSTDSGSNWFLQSSNATTLLVTPPAATPTSITTSIDVLSGLANKLVMGTNASISATGAVPSDRTIIKFTTDGACNGGAEVEYTAVGAYLTSFLTAAGSHFICYSTDTRGTFVRQNLQVWVYPPPATADAITQVSPLPVTCKSPAKINPPVINNRLSFTGAVLSNQTWVAFVLEGDSCTSGNFKGNQKVQSLETLYVNDFPVAGNYETCYSTDNGATYVKQDLASFLAVPPTPTATDVTVNSTFSSITYGVAGGRLVLGGGLASATSKLGFVPDNVGACLPTTVQGVVAFTSYNLTIPALTAFAYHYLCYSIDDGVSYTRQNAGFALNYIPDSPTSITSVSPRTVYALSPFNLLITGVPASRNTRVAFAPASKPCDSGDEVVYNDDNVLVPAFLSTGNFTLCFRLGGSVLIRQTNPNTIVTVLAPDATETSIQVISPPVIFTGTFKTTPVIFLGSVASSTTRGAFTMTNCEDGNRLAETAITASTSILSDDLDEGTYKVCYSTISGVWFLQKTASGAPITVTVSVATEGGNEAPMDLAAIIGGAVGGAVLLLLIVAAIIAAVYRRKMKKVYKLKTFSALEPQTEPSFLSDNPIFETSPMYEGSNRDHFRGR